MIASHRGQGARPDAASVTARTNCQARRGRPVRSLVSRRCLPMRALRRLMNWLYEPLPEPRTARRVVGWWEARRLACNVLIGVVGLNSLLAFFYFMWQSNVL